MRRLETRPLDGFNETNLDRPAVFEVTLADGRTLGYDDIIANTPAVTSDYDGFHRPQLVLGTEGGLEQWDENAYFPVGRLNASHGRNLEILADNVRIEDGYGNEYRSLCIKGSDLSNPYIFKSITAERDYLVNGLQESLVMERVIRASKLLRENGVDTEYICGLVLPKTFPFDGEQRPVDIKTGTKLPEFLAHLATRFAQNRKDDDGKSALEVKSEMIDRFKDCDYLVTYRAMDCPIRFTEIADPEKYEEFKEFVRQNYDGPDMEYYLRAVKKPVNYTYHSLAPALGKNIGRMHRLGLMHGFPHGRNISALGALVDLDSCHGEPLGLGDEPLTTDDYLQDATYCIRTLREVVDDMRTPEYNQAEEALAIEHNKLFVSNKFLTAYLRERFDTIEERNQCLADMLFYANDKQLLGTAVGIERYLLILCNTYKMCNQDYDASRPVDFPDISDLGPQDIEVSRGTSFVRALPIKYLRENRDKLTSYEWTINDTIPTVSFAPKTPIYHPLRMIMRSLVMSQAIKLYQQSGYDNDPQALFESLMHIERWPKSWDGRETGKEATEAYNNHLTAAVVDKLCESGVEEVRHPVLAQLIETDLGHMNEQLGYADLAKRNESNLDVLYVDGPDQYRDVFAAFGLEEAPVSFVDSATMGELLIEGEQEAADLILVADYSITNAVAFPLNRGDVNRDVLFGNADKPSMVISGLSTGEPKVYIVDRGKFIDNEEKHDEITWTSSYRELVDIYCREPDTAEPTGPQTVLFQKITETAALDSQAA